jgi:hypothetical protein
VEFSLAVVKFLEFCLFELSKAKECYSSLAILFDFWCSFYKCFSEEVFHFDWIPICFGLEPWLMCIRLGAKCDIVDFWVSIFFSEDFQYLLV